MKSSAAEANHMAANRRRTPEPMAAPPAQRRLGRVLVVEDERDVAEMIRYNRHKDRFRDADRGDL